MLLMDSGALIDIQTNVIFRKYSFNDFQIGDSPLHYASYEGRTEIVSLLVDRGANINIQKNVSKLFSFSSHPLDWRLSTPYILFGGLLKYCRDIDRTPG